MIPHASRSFHNPVGEYALTVKSGWTRSTSRGLSVRRWGAALGGGMQVRTGPTYAMAFLVSMCSVVWARTVLDCISCKQSMGNAPQTR